MAAAIAEMNERYFVAAMGSSVCIASLAHDEALGRRRLASMREGDLRLLYNRHYAVGADVKGTLIYESPFSLLSPRDPDGSHQPDRGT